MRQGELFEVQVVEDFMTCDGNTWLEIFSEKTVRGCFREILTRSDCSKQYISFGSTLGLFSLKGTNSRLKKRGG